MSASWVTAALIAMCVSSLGYCGQTGEPDGSFQIKDAKFDHFWGTKKSMPDKRSDMTATTIGDAIYLVGGCALDQEWVPDGPYPSYVCGGKKANGITGATVRYLPKADSFDTDLPNAPRPRYRHAAAALGNMLYLFGGVDGSDNIIPEVDVFDTVKGKWSTLPEKMPGATTDLSAFVHAGRIYVTGGYNAEWAASKVTQIFSPSSNGDSWKVGPSLNSARGDAFAAIVGDKAYVGAGFTHENDFKMPIASMEMLGIGQSTTFKAVKDMDIARGDKAVAVLNGMLHVVGGETKNAEGHSVPLTDVEAYDPDTNTWYKGGAIKSHRFRFVAAAHGDSIFIFGGQGYLEGGDYGKVGSKYPVLDTVEAYTETVTFTSVNLAERVLPTMAFLTILVGLVIRA